MTLPCLFIWTTQAVPRAPPSTAPIFIKPTNRNGGQTISKSMCVFITAGNAAQSPWIDCVFITLPIPKMTGNADLHETPLSLIWE